MRVQSVLSPLKNGPRSATSAGMAAANSRSNVRAGEGVAGLGEEVGGAGGGLEAAGVERIGGGPERRERGEPGFDLGGKLRERAPLPWQRAG